MSGATKTKRPVNQAIDKRPPLVQTRDPLYLAIITIALILAGLFLVLYLLFGTGKALADTPWYVPTMHSITGLAAFSVAFLALGRYSVLRDPASYWIGVGFAAFGILSMFYVFAWPGLLPGGKAIVAVLPNTSAWFACLELMSLGTALLVAAIVSWPDQNRLNGKRWLGSILFWMLVVILVSLLSIRFEQYLPSLVGPQGTLTNLLLTWDWLFLFLFGLGTVLSTRHYLATKDRLFGFVAISQIAVAFVILTALIGAKRYDIWYYLSRMILVGGFLTLMFGLLSEHVQLFRRVLDSEARYRHLTEYLPQLIWTSRPDGQFDYLSPQWLAYTGVPEAQQLGSGWLDQVHPDDRQRIMESWQATVASGGVFDTEISLRHQDGTYRWFKILALPIRNHQGRITQWFGSCTDIQDQKQAEKALQAALQKAEEGSLMLNAIMENIPIGLSITGGPPDFPLVRVSRFGLELNQRSTNNLLGLPSGKHQEAWKIFLPDGITVPQPEQMPLYRASRIGEQIRNMELVMEAQDGRRIPVLVNAAPVRDMQGKIVAAVNTWQDITEIKNAEVALQKYTSDLERSNRDLQEFAFVASHDLQEPLRKIETFSSLLLETLGNLNNHQQDLLMRIQKSTNRMRSMVDGLLQLSRLETHAQPFQQVQLNQTIKEILSDLELQVRRTGAAVEVCDLPTIEADPLQMRRLFQNLIGNALKFQPTGAKPWVSVCFQEDAQGFAQILVADNGIGFDEEHATHLFEPFKRLVGKSEYEGSGMGLAICRKIVERHNGEITVRSQPGQGTTFIVTLPVHQSGTNRSIRRYANNGGQPHVSHR